jgi:hypothetical protein
VIDRGALKFMNVEHREEVPVSNLSRHANDVYYDKLHRGGEQFQVTKFF